MRSIPELHHRQPHYTRSSCTHLKCVIEAVHSHPFPLVGLEPPQVPFLGIENAFSATCGRCVARLQMMTGMGRNVTAAPVAAACAASVAATAAAGVVTLRTRVGHIRIEGALLLGTIQKQTDDGVVQCSANETTAILYFKKLL